MSSGCRKRRSELRRAEALARRFLAPRPITSPLIVAGLVGLSLLGCEREQRNFEVPAAQARPATALRMSEITPGPSPAPTLERHVYEDNAYAIAQGKRLFKWYNCDGCHAEGGGGSGPALMDAQWIYGDAPQNIYATIVEGRPNGMPSFRGRIPEFQVWQLVAYVRSMSGLVPMDAAPGRDDSLQAKQPEQLKDKEQPVQSSLPPASQRSP
ncbi:MAG TPA: c-type cytochrome [Burkholderiales bacterium]|nr:c-type cytochrome [Burkholderiales bacterium]